MIFLYILYGILGILGFLLLIAFVNTIRIKAKKSDVKPMEIDETLSTTYANEFSKMIKIKTLSYEKDKTDASAFLQMHEVMKEIFPNVYRVMEQTVFDSGSLLFKWKGKSSEKPMVLMAHQDVVPASKKGWDFEPYSGTVTDTEILGRGTLDTKSTLYGIFKAVDELIESKFIPEQDVYISSSTDEEISGDGALHSVNFLKEKGIVPAFVLDEGGAIVSGSLPSATMPIALIGVLEKGYCNIKFVAKGKGGHSSTPPKNSPVARLSKFVADVETKFPLKSKMIPEVSDIFGKAAPSMSFGYRFLFGNLWLFRPLVTKLLPAINSYGRALLSTTIAFTMTKGSDAANVIPSEASILANLRTHPIQDIKSSFDALQKIASKYDVEAVLLGGREASPISSTSNEAYQYLIKTITENYPDVLVSPYIMLGGTDCRFFSEMTESAFRFSPIRMTNEELKKIHGKNETVRKSSIVEAVVFYKSIITNYSL